MGEWISVNYAVPPDNREILIFYRYSSGLPHPKIHAGFRESYKNCKVKWKVFDFNGVSTIQIDAQEGFHTVTHWMPLPNPPKEKE